MEFMNSNGSLLERSLASTLGKAMVTAITDFMDEGSNDSNDSSNKDRKAVQESSQAPPSLFLLASSSSSSSSNNNHFNRAHRLTLRIPSPIRSVEAPPPRLPHLAAVAVAVDS
mmetsp:Transcript_29508/g.69438  ORF Transcript_29508/g.69438 Transcript_29508/m.69438 type:complete len:113 (+) Transcript_29508:796-1134(+)